LVNEYDSLASEYKGILLSSYKDNTMDDTISKVEKLRIKINDLQ